ncbi:MAG: hypothetical protein CFE45_19800 [Burkholderiales bacterium PBB5]|nr:MAG: hypothetical protein CFE45_19800 [Burkholderiales bacterium PBB5]
MNPLIGWGLTVLGTAAGYQFFGWRGVALAVSVMVFWLLLQFSKAMRTMRAATQNPVGRVPSAVMLHAKLAKGQRLMEVLLRTRSLGDKVTELPAGADEAWRWADESGASVVVHLRQGRVTDWTLRRPEGAEPAALPADAAAPSP